MFVSPLVLPMVSADDARPFALGAYVVNFGATVEVLGYDAARGMLVRIAERGGRGQRYHASAAKCRLATTEEIQRARADLPGFSA